MYQVEKIPLCFLKKYVAAQALWYTLTLTSFPQYSHYKILQVKLLEDIGDEKAKLVVGVFNRQLEAYCTYFSFAEGNIVMVNPRLEAGSK